MIAGPAFVTPHAVQRFIARVAPGLTYEQALGLIVRGLETGVTHVVGPMTLEDGRAAVHVRIRTEGYRFIVTAVFGGSGEKPVVVTVRPNSRGRSAGKGRPRREPTEKWRASAGGSDMANAATEQRRAAAGLCVECGRQPGRPGRRSCAACAERRAKWQQDRRGGGAWHPGGPGRPPKNQGGIVEPACRLKNGTMRADHVFDEDGLCDCGTKRGEPTAFAPRPAPRPIVAKRAPAKGSGERPASPRPNFPQPTKPSLPPITKLGGLEVVAIIADLEGRRAKLDAAIAALRSLAGLEAVSA